VKTWTYSLYGLVIRSTLALPGMRTVDAVGEPEFLLAQVGEHEVVEGWDARTAQPIWTTMLSDGEPFSIERGRDGTYLFRYGQVAAFRLREGQLARAPAEGRCAAHARAPTWMRVLLGSVLRSVSLLSGFEALRASAIERREGVIAFVAPAGGGKSTLAAEFARRGDPVVCDDALALHRDHGTVWAHPGPPHLNLALSTDCRVAPTSIGVTMMTFGNEGWVAVRGGRVRRPLAAVCLVDRGVGQRTELVAAPANPLVVLPHALAVDDRPERAGERFALYSDLAASVPIHRLRAPAEAPVFELADAVEAGVALPLVRRKSAPSTGVVGA
jgi:hypothetical protein